MIKQTLMTTEKESKKFLDYINYFRAIAILLIVSAHTFTWGSSTMQQVNVYLFSGGTFLFVFISGYLFEYLSSKFDYKIYLKKKFTNVLMPFLIITFPIAMTYALTSADDMFYKDAPRFFRFFICFFSGYIVNQSMWFMGMILIFFLAAPLFLLIKKNKIIYFIVILCSIIYTLKTNRMICPFIPYEKGIREILTGTIYFYFKQFFYFASAYLGGMFLSEVIEKHKDWINNNINKIFIISLFCFIFDFVEHIFILKINAYISSSIRMIIECILFTSLFIMLNDKIRNNKTIHQIFNFIANYSFGIFFVHSIILNIILGHKIYMNSLFKFPEIYYQNNIKGFLYSITLYISVLTLSIITLWIIKRILLLFKVKNTRIFIGI